jgi:hypothetical protein
MVKGGIKMSMDWEKFQLKEILNTMDIPEMRKDINMMGNIGWLLRNIQICNSEHPNCDKAIRLLIELKNDI